MRKETVIPPPLKMDDKAQWHEAAIAKLSDYIDRNIDVDLNYFKRASIYFANDNYEKALVDINEAIREKDNVGKYYLLRGKINRELNEIANSLADVQRAETLRESGPDLYILLADLLQENKKFKEAERYLNRYMQIVPYDGTAYYVKGKLLVNKGDTLSGLEEFKKSIEYNPRMQRAYEQYIALNTKLRNYPEALVMSDRAIDRFPTEASLQLQKGAIYEDLAKVDSAVVWYESAAKLSPNDITVLEKIAAISVKTMKYLNALAAYEKIQAINSNYPDIVPLIGYCYEKSGNLNKAKELYTQILEKDPENLKSRHGMWRIRQIETSPATITDNGEESEYASDTTRIRLEGIQPLKPIGTIQTQN